ncbi:MAG TPA: tripartite tricarboxylate transporter TctB family protein [Candidatus Nesterenkonia stercoripullorum]|uniref:Tripartite tricarboxylate transporter TctB family protein n=1 Tax=Candidatus Nesterenkonia stercoripullorum TaxID=2838701 RepID=A0A9D1UU45_9MICC|nr:tripartite tricarboxylate transporter TctB family protein [Candidatus Nesterenkonia stercoripullorum]
MTRTIDERTRPAETAGRSRRRSGVLIAYAVLTLLGFGFFLGSLQYEMYSADGQVGPAYLPRYASILLVVLGLLLVMQELRGRSRLAGDSGVEDEAAPLSRRTVIKLLVVFGLITIALLLVPVLGLILSLLLLIPALSIGVERMPVVTSLLVTVGAAVLAYILFIVVLQVPLPMGVFEGAFE